MKLSSLVASSIQQPHFVSKEDEGATETLARRVSVEVGSAWGRSVWYLQNAL